MFPDMSLPEAANGISVMSGIPIVVDPETAALQDDADGARLRRRVVTEG